MSTIHVKSSPPLQGKVTISGAKNSVLPIMAATILTSEPVVIKDVPGLTDVFMMVDLLESFGGHVTWSEKEKQLSVVYPNLRPTTHLVDHSKSIRASFLTIGPLLARLKKAKIPLPGGCAIGLRPVDLHIKGLKALGAHIEKEHGFITAYTDGLVGNSIYLDFPSVGATENIMMAAVLATGKTTIENAALEPEVVDLANFLNHLGAKIRGAGTDTIWIEGVTRLGGGSYGVIPDRIEAGTYMIAAAATRGTVLIENVLPDHVKAVTAKLRETGVLVTEIENSLLIRPGETLQGVEIKTLPYPGFPTDLQAPFMTLLTQSKGISVVTETIFENRFMHIHELNYLGADIKTEGRMAFLEGEKHLAGSSVRATDLRSGAALIIAGLLSKGETVIHDAYHILRGYEDIEKKFQALGGNISLASKQFSQSSNF